MEPKEIAAIAVGITDLIKNTATPGEALDGIVTKYYPQLSATEISDCIINAGHEMGLFGLKDTNAVIEAMQSELHDPNVTYVRRSSMLQDFAQIVYILLSVVKLFVSPKWGQAIDAVQTAYKETKE